VTDRFLNLIRPRGAAVGSLLTIDRRGRLSYGVVISANSGILLEALSRFFQNEHLAREILWPLVAVLAAFVVGGIVILVDRRQPDKCVSGCWLGNSFGSAKRTIGWDTVLCDAADLYGGWGGVRVGVQVAEILLNIGRRGGSSMSLLFATTVGRESSSAERSSTFFWARTRTGRGMSLPWYVLIPFCVITAGPSLAGSGAGFPDNLRARFGIAMRVINTIIAQLQAASRLVSYFHAVLL